MLTQEILKELRYTVKNRISTDPIELQKHAGGCFYVESSPPEVVVWPETSEEITKILKICNDNNIFVVPYGAGTGVEGHTAALQGGVCLDLTKMNNVIEFSKDDFYVKVQAGITQVELNNLLKDHGLFFPVDAALKASIGGMVATGASGTNAVKYGTMRENVIGLTIVKADGSLIKTGGKTKKSSAGYDLTRIFIGSEGTLGVITEVTLKLFPIPRVIKSALCQFDNLKDATNTVIKTMQSGVNIGRVEILDSVQMDACIKYSTLTTLQAKHTLLFEFQGNRAAVEEEIKITQEIANNNHCTLFNFFDSEQEQQDIWLARKNACYAAIALDPTKKAMATDVCVPISKLSEAVSYCADKAREYGFIAPIVGHVGDGNFHLTILVDKDNRVQLKHAVALNECIMQKSLDLGGTITGEHGIGVGKMHFLTHEHGDCLATYQELKNAFDPKGILNPGKIFQVDNTKTLIIHPQQYDSSSPLTLNS
jgi:D-lactate dehydrogenase (cytochrome)